VAALELKAHQELQVLKDRLEVLQEIREIQVQQALGVQQVLLELMDYQELLVIQVQRVLLAQVLQVQLDRQELEVMV
jgi:hypothetical protein